MTQSVAEPPAPDQPDEAPLTASTLLRRAAGRADERYRPIIEDFAYAMDATRAFATLPRRDAELLAAILVAVLVGNGHPASRLHRLTEGLSRDRNRWAAWPSVRRAVTTAARLSATHAFGYRSPVRKAGVVGVSGRTSGRSPATEPRIQSVAPASDTSSTDQQDNSAATEYQEATTAQHGVNCFVATTDRDPGDRR